MEKIKYGKYFEENPNSIQYLERLISEWELHGKIIIGVDFDDTIYPWKMFDKNYKEVIDLLIEAKDVGAYITIFTATHEIRFPEITQYCKSNGLEIDSINKNPISIPFGNSSKIYANIFIDDRAGLNESLIILETAMNIIKKMKQKT